MALEYLKILVEVTSNDHRDINTFGLKTSHLMKEFHDKKYRDQTGRKPL